MHLETSAATVFGRGAAAFPFFPGNRHRPARGWERAGAALVMSLALLLAGGCTVFRKDASQPGDVEAGTVSVTTGHPDSFTPVPASARESKADRRRWIEKLCEHLADRVAEALPQGERAEVDISDIRRAAPMTASGSAQDVVPPRIALSFKRLSPGGKVVQSASRVLQDTSLQLNGRRYAGDSLGYEKALVDEWVNREFGALRR